MLGIDISNHNGVIDFNKVKASGVQAIIIKATEGWGFVDQSLGRNYQCSKDKGFNIGFYHYLYKGGRASDQARHFYNTIKDKAFNVIPVLDVEDANGEDVMSMVRQFLDTWHSITGLPIMIYTYTSFANSYLGKELCRYPLWEANYFKNNGEEHNRKGLTNIWGSNIVGHQYTDVGKVSGISGNVDLNNFSDGILINRVSESIESNQTVREECKLLGRCKNNVVRYGATGTYVYMLQSILTALGYNPQGLDGHCGNGCVAAIKQYQRDNGLDVDGSCGPATWSSILTR